MVTHAFRGVAMRLLWGLTSVVVLTVGLPVAAPDAAADPVSFGGDEVVFGFDGAGRRVVEASGGGVRVFGYDPVGRLISTTTDASSVERVLDPSGLPEIVTGPDGVTYLDWVPGGELVSLTDPDGAITTLSRPGFDSAWSSIVTGTSARAVGSDVHASMLSSTHGPGTANRYDPYGQPVGNTDAAVVSVGYRGEVTIDGLTFLRARDYDPVTGSFTTADPLPRIPGAPAASNVYGYVNNTPLNATDPTGLIHVPDPLSGITSTFGEDAAEMWSMVSAFGSAIGSTGVFQDFKAGASKKWDWVVDHKDIIVPAVVESLVTIGCIAITAGAGTTACLALGAAAGGAIYGGFNNCGNGNSISQCVTGITREAAIWAASSVAILKAARLLRQPTKTVRNTTRTTTNRIRTAGRTARSGYHTTNNLTRNSVETTANRIRTTATNRAHLRGQTGAINIKPRGATTPSSSLVRHGPLNPGPLAGDVANTFRSGTYNAVTSSNPTTLYRAYSDPARQLGPYWTRTRPTGPTQSIIDSALDPAWGNRATSWVEVNVPAGTTFYEGAAAAQRGLVGGSNQIFLPWVDDAWVVRSGGL